MTHENKIVTYWTLGVAGVLIVLVLLAWTAGMLEPVAAGG